MLKRIFGGKRGMEADSSKFEGCLLGLAIGDALGMPFEGWRPTWIMSKLGGRVKDFLPDSSRGLKAGQWTDDTKMAQYLSMSIKRSGGRYSPEEAAGWYVRWFDSGDLRGIGGATAESILRLKAGIGWRESGKTGEYAAGNGTAMRCAPIGLLDHKNLDLLEQDSRDDAVITHNNPEAVAGSRAVNFFIATGVVQPDFVDARPALIDRCAEFIGPCKVADNLLRAKELLKENMPCGTALQTLGTSGYVVETVASAVYCFLKTPDNFEETVICAVMGGGDTDTTAAVAGAISGAWNGTWSLPKRWVDTVEASDDLREIAGKLFAFSQDI